MAAESAIAAPPSALPPPPAAPGHWLLGHLRELTADPIGTFLGARARHGDVVRLLAGPRPMVLLSHPDHLRHVLQKNHAGYDKHVVGYRRLGALLGSGLVTAEGPAWLRQRQKAQPAFRKDRLDPLVSVAAQAAEAAGRRWAALAAAGDPVRVDRDMARITMRTVGEALFAADVGGEIQNLGAAFDRALAVLRRRMFTPVVLPPPIPTPLNLELMRSLKEIDRIALALIARAERGEAEGTLMAQLVAGTGTAPAERRELVDNVRTFILAGYETTANALTFTFWFLARERTVLAAVRDELSRKLGGRLPEPADVERLVYLRRVLDESLRLLPPAWATERRAIADDTIGGFAIRKNTVIVLSPFVTHRHPDFWIEPARFDPDRFEPAEVESRHPYAYLPFLAGPRGCLGFRFAIIEALVVLAVLLQRFQPEPIDTPRIPLQPGITLRPFGGLFLQMRERPV